MGTQRKKPTAKNIEAYPVAGLNDNYSGLCQFDCALDYCPTGVCTTVKAPLSTPTVSPFLPNACTSGKSKNGDFPGLCVSHFYTLHPISLTIIQHPLLSRKIEWSLQKYLLHSLSEIRSDMALGLRLWLWLLSHWHL